jgi:hypothetical protein
MNTENSTSPTVGGLFDPSCAKLSFELVRVRSASQSADSPRGEPGLLRDVGEDGFTVSFDAGCTLRVDLAQKKRAFRQGTCRIIDCEVDEPFIVLIRADLANRMQPYFMVPATLYGTNNADRGVVAGHGLGTGGDPKLAYRAQHVDGFFSHSWHFRADHAAVPSVSATFDGRFAALGIEEAVQNDQGDWLYNGVGFWTSAAHGDSISISIGSMDWPGRFVAHQVHPGRIFEPLTKQTAVGMSCRLCFGDSAAADLFAYEPFIAAWYEVLHEPPREGAVLEQAMRDVAGALVEDGIDPATGYFHMFRTPDGISRTSTLLAWAGVLQIARPLMHVGRILDEPRFVQVAADMTDRAVAEAVNPANGLFFDVVTQGKWHANDWWPGLGQTSLVNGHACYLLSMMADDDGDRRSWARAAGDVLERVMPHQREDGRFPGGFSPEDGKPLTYLTFGGCYFAAPLLMRHRFFDDPSARTAALRAIEHYWQEFARLEWIGVDMDCAGSVDSGSSYALIRALVELHRQEDGNETLDRIGHVLHYAFTYRFGHNTRHRHPVCDWSSSGSKVTSTHNVHLDAFGGEILEDLHYFLSKREDPYLRSRLTDSLAWARQSYNRTEAEYGWGKVGWTTEQYYHTYDRYHHFEGDGTVWISYFPWSAGSVLNAFVVDATSTKQTAPPR